MGILGVARTYRNLKRLKDIALILSRYGLGSIVERTRLSGHLPLLARLLRISRTESQEPIPGPERLVKMFEELGPTFVKFGQLLATRPDLVPEPYLEGLAALQDRVAPFPGAVARTVAERELRRPLAEVFAHFEEQPIASGSLAQVHFAELLDGRKVAVKIKRPEADRLALADLELLTMLAELAEKRLPELARFHPTMIVEEFSRNLRREINFLTEANSLARFGRLFGPDSAVLVPEVFWNLSSTNLLVMERVEGQRLSDLAELRRSGRDLKKLAHTIADSFMRQFFEFGCFHADPHAGNIMVLADDRIALVDFGSIGHLSDEIKNQLATTLVALVRGDIDLVVGVYTDIGVFSDTADLSAVRADLTDVLDRYYGVPASRIDLAAAFTDMIRLARRHDVQLPRDFVMLGRAFVLVSGLIRQLDPEVNVAEAVKPYAERLALGRLDPRRILRRAGANLYYLTSFIQSLPRDLRQLMKKAQTGRLTFTFRHEGLENLARELDRASNRIAFAMVIAAVIVGSSLIMSKGIGPPVPGTTVSALGAVGYLFAGFLGLGLAWSIYRSGKL